MGGVIDVVLHMVGVFRKIVDLLKEWIQMGCVARVCLVAFYWKRNVRICDLLMVFLQWVLIEMMWVVRGFWMWVDDKAKIGFLWELPGAMERLEVVRGDLMEDGSFDMAVEGVHTVFHAACPVFINPEGDPQVNYKTLLRLQIIL